MCHVLGDRHSTSWSFSLVWLIAPNEYELHLTLLLVSMFPTLNTWASWPKSAHEAISEDHRKSCDFRCCRGWPFGWFYTAARIPSLWSWLLYAQASLLSTREQTAAQPSCLMGIPRRSTCVWETLYWRGVLSADQHASANGLIWGLMLSYMLWEFLVADLLHP